jgi:hypothetical protein
LIEVLCIIPCRQCRNKTRVGRSTCSIEARRLSSNYSRSHEKERSNGPLNIPEAFVDHGRRDRVLVLIQPRIRVWTSAKHMPVPQDGATQRVRLDFSVGRIELIWIKRFSIQSPDQQSTKMIDPGRAAARVSRASVEVGANAKRVAVCPTAGSAIGQSLHRRARIGALLPNFIARAVGRLGIRRVVRRLEPQIRAEVRK